MDNKTDHAKHAARMQAAIDEKAARLKIDPAIARRDPAGILRAIDAADAAAKRYKALPPPFHPVTYATTWQGQTIPVTVPPDATLHGLITRTKAAHGLQTRSFPAPESAMPGRWHLKARGSIPAAFLAIVPDTTNRPQYKPPVSPAAALKALHASIALQPAPKTEHAIAAYRVRPVDPTEEEAPRLILPTSAPRATIAREALRLLSRVEWSRLQMTPTGAAIIAAGGKIIAHITPDPDAEDQDDDLETDEHGNFIL